jgi:hypothetical protein
MFDAINEEVQKRITLETIDTAITYLRGLKLMIEGVYYSAPKGTDVEKNIGAAYQQVTEVLGWLELRAAALTRLEPKATAGPSDDATAPTDSQGNTVH